MIVIPLLMSGYHMASPCIAPMNTGIFVLLSVLQNYTVGDRISELMHIVQVSEDPAIFWENIRTNLGSTHQIFHREAEHSIEANKVCELTCKIPDLGGTVCLG